MSAMNPLENARAVPTKEDLEDFLGPGRYRRFDTVYEELIDMDIIAKVEWNKQNKQWFHKFSFKDRSIFTIRWGIDYFYALLVLDSNSYLKISRSENLTPGAAKLIRKFPANQLKGTTRIEANLETINEQEAFFELLPLLLKELT